MRFLFVLSSCLLPYAAQACAVCGAFTEEQRGAYIGTTALMSFVPLGLIFGGAYYVYRQCQVAPLNAPPSSNQP